MKKFTKLFGIIALVAVIGFEMAACWMIDSSAVKLERPANLQVNQNYNSLMWDYVKNAYYGYTVRATAAQDAANSQTFNVTENQCSLYPLVGPEVYEICVLAKGNGSSFADSEWSEPIQLTVAAPIVYSQGLIFEYQRRSGGYQLMSFGTNRDANVNIPPSESTTYIGGWLAVKSIADNAFQNATWVESITVPSTIQRIGNSAFAGCVNISTITLSVWCTSIGDDAFSGWGADQTIRILAASTSGFSADWLRGCNANVVYE
jgi:hypothetical protein